MVEPLEVIGGSCRINENRLWEAGGRWIGFPSYEIVGFAPQHVVLRVFRRDGEKKICSYKIRLIKEKG